MSQKIIYKVCMILITLIAFCGCSKTDTNGAVQEVFAEAAQTAAPNSAEPAVGEIGDGIPVSRALTAKMLALLNFSKQEINSLARSIAFSDTVLTDWHDRFINACVINKLMYAESNSFEPLMPLKLSQAQEILNKICGDEKLKLDINNTNSGMAISYALWNELFLQVVSGNGGLEKAGFSIQKLIILAESKSCKELPEFYCITDKGPFSHFGIELSKYLNKELSVLVKGSEIVSLLELSDNTPTIKNAYVIEMTDAEITVFSGGATRIFEIGEVSTSGRSGMIADLKISGNRALSAEFYSESQSGVLKRINNDKVELLDDNKPIELPLLPDAAFYAVDDSGTVRWKQKDALFSGSDNTDFILNNGSICAAIISRSIHEAGNLRVVIGTTGFKGYEHKSVVISSDKEFTVKSGSFERIYGANEEFSVGENSLEASDFSRVFITPSGGGLLQINSISRNWPNDEPPSYFGTLEIGKETDGFSIVNEVDIEDYLKSVVPSEMPTSHGLEAAKVQAVTARSFAYNHRFQTRFQKYGANVDDSVLCQVYNNIPPTEISVQAVDETRGLCLSFNGEVISANYFSTSAGVTANAGEVWAGDEFPADTADYLAFQSQLIDDNHDLNDLSVEENAAAFFKSTDIESYDSQFPWFRWNVEFKTDELAAVINKNLSTRYYAVPKLVKTQQADGSFKSVAVKSVGELLNISVTKRGQGGNAMEILIEGTKNTVKLYTEYNIRLLLTPVQLLSGAPICLNRHEGTPIENYSAMPSAFFVIEKTEDGFKFFGGGMGHGVGMSQNGVKGMIDEGFDFAEILQHYYNGIEISKKY